MSAPIYSCDGTSTVDWDGCATCANVVPGCTIGCDVLLTAGYLSVESASGDDDVYCVVGRRMRVAVVGDRIGEPLSWCVDGILTAVSSGTSVACDVVGWTAYYAGASIDAIVESEH